MNYSAPCRSRPPVYTIQMPSSGGADCCEGLETKIDALGPHNTYQFFDAFGKEIKPQIFADRSQSPRG